MLPSTRNDEGPTQGWQTIEDSIRLTGWSKARRVVVLRRRIKQDIAVTAKRDDGQMVLVRISANVTADFGNVTDLGLGGWVARLRL
jgi:hypothetical protein